MKYKKLVFGVVGFALALVGLCGLSSDVSAFSVTPMKQAITLQPGDTYTGKVSSFVTSENNGGEAAYYEAWVAPFTVDDADSKQYMAVFDKTSDWTDIINWTKVSDSDETAKYGEKVTGVMEPGELVDFTYTIDVPKNARGGGQYFAVIIQQVPDPNAKGNGNVGIANNIQIASVVYAEIAGDIKISGSITDNNVPGFLSSPPLTTSFLVTNDGNTHVEVTYYLQVFPLFSGEEVYTTEEKPGKKYVLPGSSRMITQTWENMPSIGIFKVRQTVYYDSTDGEPSVTEKMVVVCPIWLIFLVLFGVIGIIVWIIFRIHSHKKSSRKSSELETEAEE